MNNNAEFRRNLWLEFSTHRLVAMPVVLLLYLFAVNSVLGEARPGAVTAAALWAMVAIGWFWGTRRAAESVNEELRGRTWDLQRLSALSPWAMTWGKLFGATAFTWYGVLICAAAMLFTSPTEMLPRTVRAMFTMLACGLALHGAAMAASLQAVQKDRASSPRFGFLLVLPLLLFGAVPTGIPGPDTGRAIEWYSTPLRVDNFLLCSALAFAAWGVFGAWRMMGRALLVRMTPWAIVAFAIFLSIYFAGLIPYGAPGAPPPPVGIVAVGIAVTLGLFYMLLFSEPTGAMTVRRLLLRANAGQWERAVEEMPAWPVTLALLLILAIAGVFLFDDFTKLFDRTYPGAQFLPLAIAAMAVRDAAMFLFISFAKRPRRVEMTAVLYLVVLDWMLPALLSGFGAGFLSKLIMPILSADGFQALVVMAVQAAAMVSLALWRWRRNYG